MRDLGWALLFSVGGGLITFLLAQALGLNNWVLEHTQRTWSIPGYHLLFPALLILVGVIVLFWSKKAGWTSLLALTAGVAGGHLAGVLSYLLSPFVAGTLTLAEYMDAITYGGFRGVVGFAGLTLLIAAILLSWLYGGILVAIGLLGQKLLAGSGPVTGTDNPG